MPTVPAGQNKPLPKEIHFVVIGELTKAQALRIETWAKTNPDWRVKLWKDKDSYFDRLLLEEMSRKWLKIDKMREAFREPRKAVAITKKSWDAVPGLMNDNVRILRLQQTLTGAVFNRLASYKGTTRSEEVKSWLIINTGKSREYLDEVIQGQLDIYDGLTKSNVDVVDLEPVISSLNIDEKILYKDAAYTYSDFTLARKLMQLKVLQAHGGVIVDANTFPDINNDIFSKSSSDESLFARFRKRFGGASSSVVQKEDIGEGYRDLERKARLQALLTRVDSYFLIRRILSEMIIF